MLARTATVTAVTCASLLGSLGSAVAQTPAETGASDSVAGRVVVQYLPGVEGRALARSVGAAVRSDERSRRTAVLTVARGSEARTIGALLRSGKVAFAERDGVAHLSRTPDDPYFAAPDGVNGGQWSLRTTRAPEAWDVSTGDPSVVIAVVDTGLVSTLPDFAGKVVPGWNVVAGSSDTSDSTGHGTEAAGVAAAATDNGTGVAGFCWACKVMPVKVATSSTAAYSDIANGITWAADHGADVISISIAGSTSSSALASAVSYARGKGAVVVAAAGNAGTGDPMYPAATPGVLGVAATDQADALTSYSSYGSWVQLAAPGSNTTTLPNGSYGPVGGTSMAAPAVAGIVGLLRAARPTASGSDVEQALLGSTAPLADAKGLAHGRVDAAAAVAALTGSSPTATPATSAPTSTGAPVVTGTAQAGQTLSTTLGSWSGTPTSYATSWLRCDTSGAACTTVADATGRTYTAASADVGSTLRSVVTATNAGGSGSSTSAATATVTAAPTAPTSRTSTYSGSLGKSGAASYAVALSQGATHAELAFTTKCAGLTLTLRDASGAVVAQATGKSVLVQDSQTASGSHTFTVSGSCRTSVTLTVTTPA